MKETSQLMEMVPAKLLTLLTMACRIRTGNANVRAESGTYAYNATGEVALDGLTTVKPDQAIHMAIMATMIVQNIMSKQVAILTGDVTAT